MVDGAGAYSQARAVVGLYGDPTTTWGICAELVLDDPVDPVDATARLPEVWRRLPHLGVVPPVEVVDDDRWDLHRVAVASRPYVAGDPVVRLALGADRRTLLVGAHHGVVDGLGLVALASYVTGVPITSHARGIGGRPADTGFLRRSLGRVTEAVVDPPARFVGSGHPAAAGETLRATRLPARRLGTAEVTVAGTRAFRDWPRREGRTPIVLVGASRRAGGELEADRRTAYLRLRVLEALDPASARRLLAATAPEPDFPETSARGVGPLVTRALRSRLGATLLVSNLGVLEADGLRSVAMYPALSGPRAVAIGLASTASTTTLTLRTREREFTPEEADDLLAAVVAHAGEPGVPQ